MAKHKKDIMCVRERQTKHGLSLDLFCSGKDPLTLENKTYVRTYRVPSELIGKKEIEADRLRVQLEWKAEVEKMSFGTVAKKSKVKFADFADEWVENILKRRPQGYSYYRKCKDYLPVLTEKLSSYYLHQINQFIVQDFVTWVGERKYTKETVTVKESLASIIKQGKKMTYKKAAQKIDISQATLFEALTKDKNISKDVATRLCDFLNVPLLKYFDIQTQEIQYSLGTNQGIKTMLHSILAHAVKKGLMERNFASSEFIDPVTGRTTVKKEILDNKEDIQTFIRYANAETDIRKKAVFLIYINLGLRNAEVAGLTWDNINFDTNEISIEQNTIYVTGFGTLTKDTKTLKSKRVLSMPKGLVESLKEYKDWWDIEKANHGDLWEHTNKLFVTNNGKDMNGMTLRSWLRKFQEKNGLKKVSPHGLRRTNTTMLITNGADVKTVSARLGHADIKTTLNIYSSYTTEADRKTANLIDILLNS